VDERLSDYRIAATERSLLAGSLALTALEIALDDVGRGEIGANNAGAYVWSLTGRKTSGAWCAAAVYTWIKRAANRVGVRCPVPRIHSARKLVAAIIDAGGEVVDQPMPGDIVLWSRGRPWQGHVGIVAETCLQRFRSVEGNRGRFPALVKVFTHRMDERRLLRFVTLP